MDWRQAFIEQARSDNAVRRLLNRESVEYAHQLHYIQMATEKLARGCLAEQENPPKRTHTGFVQYLRGLRRRPEIRRQLGYRDARAFASYVDSLLPLAWQVERLAPALATAGPNPEYPWQDSVSGDVIVPAAFDFDAFSPNRPRMAKLIELLDSLLAIAS